MNRLPLKKRVQILHLLVEGNSLRSTSRLADVSINTVTKLLVDVGKACLKFHSETVVQLRCERVECDEIWSFVYAKQKNAERVGKGGDVWTWIAMDPDTKLVISWHAGRRDQESANFFMNDVWCRLRTRVQMTTDGYICYREAVDDTFGRRIDFAKLVKQYSSESTNKDGKPDKRQRYTGAEKKVIMGRPNLKTATTAHVERQNLTMRMHMRRFTRESNAFSKKLENHDYSLAIHFVYYNFVRRHRTIRVTPAMEAKLTKKFMTMEEMLELPQLYSVNSN